MAIFKNITVYSYSAQYNHPNMRNPFPSNNSLFDTIRKNLNLTDYRYFARTGYIVQKQDFAAAFNRELPLSDIHDGDIILLRHLNDISYVTREALKKIERYSRRATIYILSIDGTQDYSQYRRTLLALYGLRPEDCDLIPGPKGKSDIPNVKDIKEAYEKIKSGKASYRQMAVKLHLTVSTLHRRVQKYRNMIGE